MRYRFQGGELSIPVPAGTLGQADIRAAAETFRSRFEQTYGARYDLPVQLLHFRVRATGAVTKPRLGAANRGECSLSDASKGMRPVYFRGAGFLDTPVYDRGLLRENDVLRGPAIVEEPDSTTVVPPGYRASVDAWHCLVIERPSASEAGPA